jgi:hypothetical protein
MTNSAQAPIWSRSSRCGTNACVEVAKVGDEYLIRDSKNPEQAPLRFTEEELSVFAAAFAAGEFRSA